VTEEWFDKYRTILVKYNIKRGKNIYNIDELGVRVRCPKGEEVVVSIEVKEMYTSSLENHKSMMIIKVVSTNGREPPQSFVICLGK
jgi:hypothetical protein